MYPVIPDLDELGDFNRQAIYARDSVKMKFVGCGVLGYGV